MAREKGPRKRSARRAAEALPPDIGLLLNEIEKEPVPERLLVLATRLQEALARKRAEKEMADEGAKPPVRQARQSP